MKKVLFIAHFFPPLGGSGVQRSVKFVKYLPEFGWRPTVLTQKGSGYIKDQAMLGELPKDLRIIRAPTLDPSVLIDILGKVGISRESAYSSSQEGAGKTPHKKKRATAYSQLAKLKKLMEHHLLIPDSRIGWLPFCYASGARELAKRDYDAIYTTSAPYTSHLIGGLLRKTFDVPWITDFRDEWTKNPFLAEYVEKHRFVLDKMEHWVLETADAIVTVSEDIAESFAEILPESRKKIHSIPNGYDEEDFAVVARGGKNIKFRISYVGTFYQDCQPTEFLSAVRKLLKNRRLSREEIEINFIGPFDRIHDLENIMEEFAGVLNVKGAVPHARAVEEMVASDALLLVIPAQFGDRGLAGKLFEYLAAGPPIIASIPTESRAAKIIRETGGGIVVPNDRHDLLADAIVEMKNAWERGKKTTERGQAEIGKYSRKYLAGQLADILNNLSLKIK
jgi:glycosyltransferase involved in cell wall biosynthesis